MGQELRAKEGRIVIFPSGWTFLHRGYPPKDQRKYICTGWLHAMQDEYSNLCVGIN